MRFPNSWSAVRIEFARYLIAALRLHGVLPTVAHGRDGSPLWTLVLWSMCPHVGQGGGTDSSMPRMCSGDSHAR
jgi:hypothetical protein